MDQDKAVNRVLRDLKLMGLIDPELNGEIKPYLQALWVAGWEVGKRDRNQGHNKAIGQYNKKGQLINSYKSLTEASKITRFAPKSIRKAMYLETPTKQGWLWKWL